jgi:8-oxo-dGTP pyrophosphatase MutT (NUDIX family)
MGFPGGLVDAADRDDLRHTALRELQEELGIGAEAVTIVHRLPDALVINRTVLVAPFVGVLTSLPALRIDPEEVEAALDVPLRRIVAPGALHEGIEAFGALRIPTWQFDDGAIHVWGATAWMLRSLLEAVAENPNLAAALRARGITFA